ncbi:hypothetical protein [Halomonas koreensis]|uniref:Uncharacterized protein n=1 Tax=Halomonas koreensis TaxID=245385 RepID=A0ABU1G559_9GAMM|nr:hypothetical protein [Halomonas koreensis]MDR5868072.1 hypothetical protein [Halomonas koreensis]
MPSPLGHWMMLCPCGAVELRATQGPAWHAFELAPIAAGRYRITCRTCGHTTERAHHREAAL